MLLCNLGFGRQKSTHTFVKDNDFVTIHNRINAMCNADDGAQREFIFYSLLNEGICFCVHRRRRLVKHKNSALLEKCTAQTEELALAYAPILTILQHCFRRTHFFNQHWLDAWNAGK